MAKKKALSSMSVSELQTMIDDQIYRHLPISKLTDIKFCITCDNILKNSNALFPFLK